MNALFLLGRMLFGGYFVYNGINHFRNRPALAGYAEAKQVPAPHLAVSATGAMMLAGGLSVVTGFQPKVGSGLVLAFLLGVSPQMHNFWKAEDPAQRQADFINFAKNMALVGSALMLMSRPEPWPMSVAGSDLEHLVERVRRAA